MWLDPVGRCKCLKNNDPDEEEAEESNGKFIHTTAVPIKKHIDATNTIPNKSTGCLLPEAGDDDTDDEPRGPRRRRGRLAAADCRGGPAEE